MSISDASGDMAEQILNWNISWEVHVVAPQKFLLRCADWSIKFSSTTDVCQQWVEKLGLFLSKRKQLQEEREKVLAVVQSQGKLKLSTSNGRNRGHDRPRSIEMQAKSSFYSYMALASETYVDQFSEFGAVQGNNVTNELFQTLSSQKIILDPENASDDKNRYALSLISLVEDFLNKAQHYGKIIISEVFVPAKEKTIKPVSVGGVIGGEKFIVANILFKFAIDMGVFEGDHSSAAKVAGLELQGLRAYYGTHTPGLHFPLMAMIDKKGFRLIASSLLPLKELIYGSNDAAHTIFRENDDLNKLIETASHRLNLKPHMCGLTPDRSKLMYSCVDLEGHMGTDGRFYLLDFSRVMPPVTPSRSKANSHLFEMFRSEFVAKYRKPLCSDAYSRFTIAQKDFGVHNDEVDTALQELFSLRIPEFALYFKSKFAHYKQMNVDFTKVKMSNMLHEHGINVRYMGKVLSDILGIDRIRVATNAVVGFLDLLEDDEGRKRYGDDSKNQQDETELRPEDFVAMEMVARTAKDMLRSRLRFKMEQLRVPIDEPFIGVVVKLLNELFGLSKESMEWWTDNLIPSVEKKFGVGLNVLYGNSVRRSMFKRDGLPFLLWNRLTDMMGLVFAPTIRELLQSENGIFELPVVFTETDVDLGDRVKSLDFVSVARGYLAGATAVEMENMDLLEAAEANWKKAEAYFAEALTHRPDDPARMTLAARALTRLAIVSAKLGRVPDGPAPSAVVVESSGNVRLSQQNPMVARALSLTERACSSVVDSEDAVTVKLARANLLEACGMLEQSESLLMKTVLEHSDSIKCIETYAKFLEKAGEKPLAQKLEQTASMMSMRSLLPPSKEENEHEMDDHPLRNVTLEEYEMITLFEGELVKSSIVDFVLVYV